MLEGMRAALLEGAGVRALLAPSILPLLLTGVIMIPVGLYTFSRAERYAKVTGKLKRNG
jgi:ABC-2 type transport system permease protein